jgi:hypothetical protein
VSIFWIGIAVACGGWLILNFVFRFYSGKKLKFMVGLTCAISSIVSIVLVVAISSGAASRSYASNYFRGDWESGVSRIEVIELPNDGRFVPMPKSMPILMISDRDEIRRVVSLISQETTSYGTIQGSIEGGYIVRMVPFNKSDPQLNVHLAKWIKTSPHDQEAAAFEIYLREDRLEEYQWYINAALHNWVERKINENRQQNTSGKSRSN